MPKKPRKPPEPELLAEPVESPSRSLGRPTSFDPEYLRQAEFLCGRGAATDEELADFFQVTKRTINRWKLAHPEFALAIQRGKDAADGRVVESLYHKAMERETEEEQAIKLKTVTYGDNGKRLKEEERVEIVTVKKLIPADTTAMIFWLKNRQAQNWRDVHKHEHGGAGAFDKMDDQQLSEYIDAKAQEIVLDANGKGLQKTAVYPSGRKQDVKH